MNENKYLNVENHYYDNNNVTREKIPSESELKIQDHFNIKTADNKYVNNDYLVKTSSHFTKDPNSPNQRDKNRPALTTDFDGVLKPVNSGSSSIVNPDGDLNKQNIIEQGLCNTEANSVINKTGSKYAKVPISPLYPFTRLDPKCARKSMFVSYNRTKLPIVDTEFRKGFRHVFFTRPECYIMSRDNRNNANVLRLSEQCSYDEDFSSSYSRMPHILKILSPAYVTGSFSQNSIDSNWNYLLSNRITSMQSVIKTGAESAQQHVATPLGYGITTPSYVTSMSNSTISVAFSETKNLEVYEMLRLWMLYNHKRKYGIFSPPYNGYQYRNEFLNVSNGDDNNKGMPVYSGDFGNKAGVIYHPYDRALENCASIFEIYTNESMTKILYWCKYYGVYPEDASIEGLSSDIDKAMTAESGLKCNATFRYQRKLENVYKSLVEFNLNAGITDNMGKIKTGLTLDASYPFLLRSEDASRSALQNQTLSDSILTKYIGASGMFTGSPYIVIGKNQDDVTGSVDETVLPYLMFTPLTNMELNNELNLGIENNRTGLDNNTQYLGT